MKIGCDRMKLAGQTTVKLHSLEFKERKEQKKKALDTNMNIMYLQKTESIKHSIYF